MIMNRSAKKFIKIYLIIGVIWGLLARFPFGIMLSEYAGNKAYENKLTNVTESYLTDSGDLVLCMQGRLIDSRRYKTKVIDFSLKIPISNILLHEVYNSDLINISTPDSTALSLSDKLISDKCKNTQKNTKVQVRKSDYTPDKAFNFYSVRDLKGLKPVDEKGYMILIVPTVNTYPKPHFMERIRVFIIMDDPDVIGRQYYEISLKDTWIDRDIGIHEYVLAFVKDALFYPVAIFMMGRW